MLIYKQNLFSAEWRDGFAITKAAGFLYDDDDFRVWEKPDIKVFPFQFRMLDDDGTIYFWGMSKKDHSFKPLDDYGADFGCTEIQYYHHCEWETL